MLLFACIIALWVRSYFVGDEWRWDIKKAAGPDGVVRTRTARAWCSRGGLWLSYRTGRTAYDPRVLKLIRRWGEAPNLFLDSSEWRHLTDEAKRYPVIAPVRPTGRADMAWEGRTHFDHFGFGFQESAFTFSSNPPRRDRFYVVLVPLWFVAVILFAPSAAWMLRRRRGRMKTWQREGRCLSCGYDLRATPGACPECGPPRMTRRERAALLRQIDESGIQNLGGEGARPS